MRSQMAGKIVDGPDKMTRGGVNGRQSKFFARTWPICQIEPDAPLFQLDQDHIPNEELLEHETGLGNTIRCKVSHERTYGNQN
jgi:hypothetical protein